MCILLSPKLELVYRIKTIDSIKDKFENMYLADQKKCLNVNIITDTYIGLLGFSFVASAGA